MKVGGAGQQCQSVCTASVPSTSRILGPRTTAFRLGCAGTAGGLLDNVVFLCAAQNKPRELGAGKRGEQRVHRVHVGSRPASALALSSSAPSLPSSSASSSFLCVLKERLRSSSKTREVSISLPFPSMGEDGRSLVGHRRANDDRRADLTLSAVWYCFCFFLHCRPSPCSAFILGAASAYGWCG